jgi:hypothetical protein
MTRSFPPCHGRAWPGHPRLAVVKQAKTWMGGHGTGMTAPRYVSAYADKPA